MRKHIKVRLIDLSQTILIVHDEILNTNTLEQRLEYFSMCEEASKSISHYINMDNRDFSSQIALLESYRKEIFNLSKQELLNKSSFQKADSLIEDIINFLNLLPVKKEVVFLPYQASMWDSLESIWEAFMRDNNYYCSVVPIPYSEYQKEINFWKPCYDGNNFPSNIPILNYNNFSLEEIKPDLGFIHNPYDETNFITRVDSDYYSYNLKNHIKNLVYVPYFNSGLKLNEKLENLSGYYHSDYLVFSSEFKENTSMVSKIRDKILPLGSPKYDKVINTCKTGVVMPEQWKDKCSGKKIVMLNTTIKTLLDYKGNLLKKLNFLFFELKQHKDVVVIWRPHPLIKSTIEAMLPNLKSVFNKLLSSFVNNNIGILDQTPNFNNTLALCDAYIGDATGSVPYLFGVSGKPMFILKYDNKFISEEDNNRRINLSSISKFNNELYAVSSEHGGLFKINQDFSNINYESPTNNINNLKDTYKFNVIHKDKIYLSPSSGGDFMRYDIVSKSFEKLCINIHSLKFDKVLEFNNKIIYLPLDSNIIAIYDTLENKWIFNYLCLKELFKNDLNERNSSVLNYSIFDNKIYICSRFLNTIVEFDVNKNESKSYTIDYTNIKGFTAINIYQHQVYLAELKGNIINYNLKTKQVKLVELPKEFNCWMAYSHEKCKFNISSGFVDIISVGDFFVAIPDLSNNLVKINKNSGEAGILVAEALSDKFINPDQMLSPNFPICELAYVLDDENLVIQLNYTGKFIKINVKEDAFEYIDLKLEKPEYDKFVKELNGDTLGFITDKNTGNFIKPESKHNSLYKYLDDIANNNLDTIKKYQEEVYLEISSNLDGTCGKKVHEFFINLED